MTSGARAAHAETAQCEEMITCTLSMLPKVLVALLLGYWRPVCVYWPSLLGDHELKVWRWNLDTADERNAGASIFQTDLVGTARLPKPSKQRPYVWEPLALMAPVGFDGSFYVLARPNLLFHFDAVRMILRSTDCCVPLGIFSCRFSTQSMAVVKSDGLDAVYLIGTVGVQRALCDPSSWILGTRLKWQPLPVPVAVHAAVGIGRFLVVTGGRSAPTLFDKTLNSCFAYFEGCQGDDDDRPKAGGTWVRLPDLTHGRYEHLAAVVDDHVVVMGGRQAANDAPWQSKAVHEVETLSLRDIELAAAGRGPTGAWRQITSHMPLTYLNRSNAISHHISPTTLIARNGWSPKPVESMLDDDSPTKPRVVLRLDGLDNVSNLDIRDPPPSAAAKRRAKITAHLAS